MVICILNVVLQKTVKVVVLNVETQASHASLLKMLSPSSLPSPGWKPLATCTHHLETLITDSGPVVLKTPQVNVQVPSTGVH